VPNIIFVCISYRNEQNTLILEKVSISDFSCRNQSVKRKTNDNRFTLPCTKQLIIIMPDNAKQKVQNESLKIVSCTTALYTPF